MRFITLNVKGASKTRKEFVPYQVAALMTDRPDFVALSEVAINRLADYEREFQRHGLPHVLSSVAEATAMHAGSRSVGTLIASRFTCTMRSGRASDLQHSLAGAPRVRGGRDRRGRHRD